tara:strand:- start:605 stop:1243 length:639 start_codon:yes stop_codon:yes gene_type:complete
MYTLVEEASKVLRFPTKPFDFEQEGAIDKAKELEKKLSETMEKYGGIGLSANQCGVDAKVFVMRTADKGTVAFFNAEINQVSQETELMKEGCLSFPDLYLMIKRPKVVGFNYYNSDGEEKFIQLEGLGARCVQHELDHLNGIVFLQRASRLKLERALKARPKERKKRLEYEKRRAIAEAIQRVQSDTDSKSDIDGEVSESNTLPQESSTSTG